MTLDPDPFAPAVRRQEISTASAQTVLAAAARRLVQAYDDYEDALDRHVTLSELQLFDQEVSRAEHTHTAAQLSLVDG